MTRILLIDDDILERQSLKRCVDKIANSDGTSVHHAFKCSEAIDLLLQHSFDLVMLDNLLAASISGKFSVPMIKQYLGSCPLVIISNNIDVDYLQDPETLGVDAVIDKRDLDIFMLKFLESRDPLNFPKIAPLYSAISAA